MPIGEPHTDSKFIASEPAQETSETKYVSKKRPKTLKPNACLIKMSGRVFNEFAEADTLPWLKTSKALATQKRVKFANEADFESDEESIRKEQKKCLSDLRLAINKFVRAS